MSKSLRKIKKKVNYNEDEEDYSDDDYNIEEESESLDDEELEPEEIEIIPKSKKKRTTDKKNKLINKIMEVEEEDSEEETKNINLGKKREREKIIKPKKILKNENLLNGANIDNSKNNNSNMYSNEPYDYKKNYFYQNITPTEWNQISQFIEFSLKNPNINNNILENFFINYPNMYKGENNLKKLFQILNEKSQNNTLLSSYKTISNYIILNYYMPKPSIFEVYFFPNPNNEIYVINMLQTCKNTMDIAIFTMTNIKFANVITNLFNRGVKIRIIADDECCKMQTSNIYSLAALGIEVKTDDSVRYYMHHKFAVIDNSVVITGSFNWTSQAVNHNQENILFLENKNLAKKYANEFQRLWDDFEVVISKESALRILKDEEDKKKAIENRKRKEKERKLALKESMKKIKNEENKNGNLSVNKKSLQETGKKNIKESGFKKNLKKKNNNDCIRKINFEDNNNNYCNNNNNNELKEITFIENNNNKEEKKGKTCCIF